MAYTLTSLAIASTLAIAGPTGSVSHLDERSPSNGPGASAQAPAPAGSLHLRASTGGEPLLVLGRTDAPAGAILQIVAVGRAQATGREGFAPLRQARSVGRVLAGPGGTFGLPIPSGVLEWGGTIGVLWASLGGGPGIAWTALPQKDPATPHAVPPARRALVVTEFMKNPAAVTDARGEWFEVLNRSSEPIDLDGWTLRDDGSNNTLLAAPGGTGIIAPGEFLVLGRNADPALNGGVSVAITYSGFTLGNGADEIILAAPGHHVIDRVDYGDGPLWPDEPGRSVTLIARAWGNDLALLPDSWCSSTSPLPGGDMGTPGAVNDPCGP